MTEQAVRHIEVQLLSRSAERHSPATLIQGIGHAAWQAQLPHRTPAEIDHVFPPGRFERQYHETMEDLVRAEHSPRMREFGRGVLAVAIDPTQHTRLGYRPLGYALLRNTVSGNTLERALKTYGLRRLPYVWLQSINVHPHYQRQGIGSALIMAAGMEFDDRQPTTAYVYDENPGALQFFDGLGYHKLTTEPEPIPERFGPATAPALQWALRAPGIGDVTWKAAEVIERKGIDLHVERYEKERNH